MWIGVSHSCVKANTSQIEYRTEFKVSIILSCRFYFSDKVSSRSPFNKSKAQKAIKRFDISLLLLKVVIF